MAETFQGPYIITKVNKNGTIKMKTKFAKYDQFVNQNQLVKYKQPAIETKIESETEYNEHPVNRVESIARSQKGLFGWARVYPRTHSQVIELFMRVR